MSTLILLYTHIGALVLGWAFDEWRVSRRGSTVDFVVLGFIAVAWPWALYLIIKGRAAR